MNSSSEQRAVDLSGRLLVPPLSKLGPASTVASARRGVNKSVAAGTVGAAKTAATARPARLSTTKLAAPVGQPNARPAARPVAPMHKIQDLDSLLAKFAGPTAPAGFAYLQTRTTPDQTTFDVYDLVVVEYKDIRHENYYTVSAKGITHYFKGNAEFMTIPRWSQERHSYRRMMSIPFFARYVKWKPFVVWRREISTARMRGLIRTLDARLFIMDPVLREALVAVQRECLQITQISAIRINQSRTYLLQEFRQTQLHQLETIVQQSLTLLQDSTLQIVERACNQTLDMSAESVRKNMAGIKQQNTRFTYTEQAARRNASRRLRRFVLLADYYVIGALYEMAQYTAKSVLSAVMTNCNDTLADESIDVATLLKHFSAAAVSDRRDDKRQLVPGLAVPSAAATAATAAPTQPLFFVTVQLIDGQMTLRPSTEDLTQCLDDLFSMYMEQVKEFQLNFGRVTCIDEATQREVAGRMDGEAIVNIIQTDETFDACLNAANLYVQTMMASAEEFVSQMNSFPEMYRENAQLDLHWLQPPLADDMIDKAVKYFERNLTLFVDQMAQIDAIPDESQVKNLKLDSRELKKALGPSPKGCFLKLCQLLPEFSRALDTDLLDRINQSANILRSEPTSIEDMVTLLDHLDQLQENYPAIEKRCEHVQICYGLIEKYKIAILPTDLAHYQTLDPTMKRLKEVFTVSLDTRIDKIHALSMQLEKAFADLASRSIALRNRVQDPVILDTGSKPSDALRVIEELTIDLERLETTAADLVQVQTHFDLTVTNNMDLIEAGKELAQREAFWKEEEAKQLASLSAPIVTAAVATQAAVADIEPK